MKKIADRKHRAWDGEEPGAWDILQILRETNYETTFVAISRRAADLLNKLAVQVLFLDRHQKPLAQVPFDWETAPENYENKTLRKQVEGPNHGRDLRRHARNIDEEPEQEAGVAKRRSSNVLKSFCCDVCLFVASSSNYITGLQTMMFAMDLLFCCPVHAGLRERHGVPGDELRFEERLPAGPDRHGEAACRAERSRKGQWPQRGSLSSANWLCNRSQDTGPNTEASDLLAGRCWVSGGWLRGSLTGSS